MKRRFFLKLTTSIAILIYFINFSFAQENAIHRDTISMDAGRINDVYYSLKNGETTTEVRDNWHIGFSTRLMDVSIRTNGAIGVKLYTYPNANISGWDNVDTTGLSGWIEMYNDDTDWENGAFNLNSTGHPDYGWGKYSDITHHITGDSLYILGLPDGQFLKLAIVMKNTALNQYTIKYAAMDGTNEMEKDIVLNDYSTKNFIGYSFSTNDVVDREPASQDWDLVFTKYMTFYGGIMWYPVTGILQNYNVEVATYAQTDTSFMDYSVQALDSTIISGIGNNWYELQGGMPPSYVITDSLVYFVSDQESSIWKLVIDFYGDSLGNIGFKKQLLEDNTSISEISASQSGNLAVQPNPARGFTIVLFDADKAGSADLSIYDLNGSKITSQKVNYQSGLNNHSINISALPTGVYLLTLTSDKAILKNKLIVQ